MEMRKRFIARLGILSVGLLVMGYYLSFNGDIYHLIRNWLNAEIPGYDNAMRNIGTNIDLWLNGYLGIFFRFKMFGAFNWLAIPLFIYFLLNISKKKKWEIALWLALSATSVFICLQGYKNYRYQLTLYPALLTAILLFGWQISEKKSRKIRSIAVLICCGTLLITFYSLRDHHYLQYLKPHIFNDKPGFPHEIIKYIKSEANLGENDRILEFNQPILYYYTEKKGIGYGSIAKILSKKNNKEKIFWDLKQKFNVAYILTYWSYENRLQDSSYAILNEIAKWDCKLLIEEYGYKLYAMEDKPLDLSIDGIRSHPAVINVDFSKEIIEKGMQIDDIIKQSGSVEIQGYRGNFRFLPCSGDESNYLRISLIEPPTDADPEIQFGFCDTAGGDKLKVSGNSVVALIVQARVWRNNRDNTQLFIQDKVDGWVREKIFVEDLTWNDYLIVRKIRMKAEKICFGINWFPENTAAWLDLRSIKVFSFER